MTKYGSSYILSMFLRLRMTQTIYYIPPDPPTSCRRVWAQVGVSGMDLATIGSQKKPATHSGYVGYDADTVKVRLHSICFSVKSTLFVSALASTPGDVLKAYIRSECRELSLVPNEQIRLLYRGIEISDGIPLAEHVSSCAELDLHFLVLAENTGIELLQCDGVPCPKVLAECLQECADGLRQAEPLLTESGCGGAYFLRGKEDEQTLAVFKPKDEEGMLF